MRLGSKRCSKVRAGHTKRVPTLELPSPPPVVNGVSGAGARLLAWLDRIGIQSMAQRDAAAALAWSVLSAAVLALLLGALVASEQISIHPQQSALIIGIGTAQCLLLAIRRTHPIVCILMVSVLQVVFTAALPTHLVLLGAGPVVAAFTVGSLVTRPPLVGVLASSLGLQVVGSIAVAATGLSPDREPLGFSAAIGWGIVATGSPALFLVSAASIGAGWALSRERQRLLGAWVAATVEHQAMRTSAAVATERTRMARELHDIAAHHLSALIIQAAAAERTVDSNPDRAKQIIREVRAQGRETLADMRSIVGILRDTEGGVRRGDGDAPIPGLEQLESLIDSSRALGDDITLKMLGPTISLSPLADVTAYRIAQEALANARRHAPTAPVTVTITTTSNRLVLMIENPLRTGEIAESAFEYDLSPVRTSAAGVSFQGHGLLGMRERATLIGGQLMIGLGEDDVWRVIFQLPLVDDRSSAEAFAAPDRKERMS